MLRQPASQQTHTLEKKSLDLPEVVVVVGLGVLKLVVVAMAKVLELAISVVVVAIAEVLELAI